MSYDQNLISWYIAQPYFTSVGFAAAFERMMIAVLHLAGNLLNSLMGSGEEDDGTEEPPEDSPIELDWARSLGRGNQEQTHEK